MFLGAGNCSTALGWPVTKTAVKLDTTSFAIYLGGFSKKYLLKLEKRAKFCYKNA